MANLLETANNNISAFKRTPAGQTEPIVDSVEAAENNPLEVAKKFYSYYCAIRDLFDLTPEDIVRIKAVNEKLGTTNGADKFLEVFGEFKDVMIFQVRQIGNIENPHNQTGISELARMMNNAWEIKQTDPNWTPTDGDPRADNVIWGFVKGATDPETDIDFVMCHGIERTLTEYWKDLEFTQHKDWLLCALNDVIALKGLRGEGHEAKLLPMWSKPRPDGLGWISERRRTAYVESIAT